MSQSIWFLFRFFTPRVCELGLPLGTPWTPQKLDWMLSYFADCIQILVLAALSWADGWKSTAIRKITTEPIQVKLLLIVPIRCPNPQSSGVKNRSQQPNFFEIPNIGIFIIYYHPDFRARPGLQFLWQNRLAKFFSLWFFRIPENPASGDLENFPDFRNNLEAKLHPMSE